MSNRKELVERRENKRFQVPKDAFVALGPHYVKLGQMMDVSTHGLAFCYIPAKQPSNVAAVLDTFLHIFSSNISFCLLGVPIKTISDFEIKNKIAFNSTRRRGVEFGDLKENQKSQLEYLMQNYTADDVGETIDRSNWNTGTRIAKALRDMSL